jgi:hypothetical protein
VGFLITTLILFAFTLLVPGFASTLADDIARAEAAKLRAEAEAASAQQAKATAENAREALSAERDLLEAILAREAAEARRAELAGTFSLAEKQALDDAKEALEGFIQKNKELLEEYDNLAGASSRFAKGFVGDLAGMMGMTKRFEDTFVGGFMQSVKSAGSLGGALKDITSEFNKTFTAANIVSSVFAKIKEVSFAVAKAQSEARSSFMRTTGASEEFAQSINDVYFETRQFGVDSREAGAATEALFTNMASFSRESRNTREALIRQTALMAEFGVSVDVTTRSMDVMTRVLGMTGTEAIRSTEEMISFARNIGVPPAQMIEELTATAPRLAQWGSQTTEVLMDVAATSKATGIAMGDLVGIAEQFDTFEGAAEAAGRLNAMLGGPFLNNVELLTATPSEKINLLSDAVNQSGQDFASMDRFMQQSIARAAGITDMSQAARIFGMSTRDAARELERQNQEQETAEQRALAAQAATEKLAILMESFATNIQPVIEFVGDLAAKLARLVGIITENKFGMYALVGAIGAFTAATIGIGIAAKIGAITTAFGTLATAIGLSATAVGRLKWAVRGLLGATGIGVLLPLLGELATRFMPQSPPLSHWIEETAGGLDSLGSAAGSTQSQIARLNQNGLGDFEQSFTPQSLPLSAHISEVKDELGAMAGVAVALGPILGPISAALLAFRGGDDEATTGATKATTGTNNEMLARIAKGTEQNTRLLAKMASKDYKIVMNEREFGKATRDVVERQFAFQKGNI